MSKINELEELKRPDADISDILQEVTKQAREADDIPIDQISRCTDDDRIACALRYGPQAIDNKILVSISENINIMATKINQSEEQKTKARNSYVVFFQILLVALVLFACGLIAADTFWGYTVRIEFLVSVIVAIIADVFAIVQTLVKYMTSLEHYAAYNKLIDSLLKYINHGASSD